MIIGTSGQVAPACKLPKFAKTKSKAKVIEISTQETAMSPTADLLLLGPAGVVLPALADATLRLANEVQSQSDKKGGTSKCSKAPMQKSSKRRLAKRNMKGRRGGSAPAPRDKKMV